MPKLHLVGITPDNKGLLLSEHARSKRGDLVLEIDDKLLEAIERAHRLRVKEEGRGIESAALPSKRDDRYDGSSASDRLSPREIQHRLRLGESVATLARTSGTDEAWIERFAPPVFAEQARVVQRATTRVYNKPRVGPSAVPLGQAVAANVFEKGATLTVEEIDEGWGAHMRPEGVWCVTFSFSHKGRRQLAEWDVDPSTDELTARNKLAGDLGYRESGRKMRAPEAVPAAAKAPARPPVKKTVVKKAAAPRSVTKPAVKPPVKPKPSARSVPQTLPGTSTETAAPPAPASGAAPQPTAAPAAAPVEDTGPAAAAEPGSPATGPVSMAHRPAPTVTPPAPRSVFTQLTSGTPRVATGGQPGPEGGAAAKPAEEAPAAKKPAPAKEAPAKKPAAKRTAAAKKAPAKPSAEKPVPPSAVSPSPSAEKPAPAPEPPAPPAESSAPPADTPKPPDVTPIPPAGSPPPTPASPAPPVEKTASGEPGKPDTDEDGPTASGAPDAVRGPGPMPLPEPPPD